MRNKGGIAIYTRSNLKVKNVYRAKLYELLCLKLRLPSEHNMLVCGLYHPPKVNYKECDLMDHVIEILDNELEQDPHISIVLGGDLNQLNLSRLETMSGLKSLVDFPTRGESCLDNYLTNREDLFNKCHPIQMLMKTDHKGVIMPAGSKLKPFRQKVQIRDVREHRKRNVYTALNSEDWDDVFTSTDVNCAVNTLENKIINLMDSHMPLRTVSMSSRDPSWMSPLLKSILRDKARISNFSKDRLNTINERISEVISENRRERPKRVGSRDWWNHVDATSQRRSSSTNMSLSNEELCELNEYFSNLCTDNSYTEPSYVAIDDDEEVPELTELQVWNCLTHLKNTAMGPDRIPSWIWKDNAEILVPVVTKIWNLSLASHTWPTSWKRATIKPLLKVEIPKSYQDYRGINITPVIARAFERIVYQNYVKDTLEKNLTPTQFAYRQGGNCTNALLSIQNEVYKHLDNTCCKAVRMFAMDFSKAFDSVNYDLLARKLRTLGLNSYLHN
ncbi:uncharacterized protein [Montipora capricornis]|uniref:uncharacterized protein n=1 Tax=Montipora capricornis TaxID=246305 RepID=UPI0035F1730D